MKLRTVVLAVTVSVFALAQDAALTRDTIIQMVKGGLPEDVILGKIKGEASLPKMTTDDLIALKTAGASDGVIRALAGPVGGAAIPTVTYSAPVPSGAVFDDEVHWMDSQDKEVPATIEFNGQKKILLVTPERRKGAPIEIPFASIDKLSYEQSSHHRIKTGAIVMLASLGAGAIVMATKSTNHWLYVDYKAQDGTVKDLVVKLDKGRYGRIITAANEITGKTVVTIHAARKGGK